jgi:beta-aspartyl-peptidase (threonine type)
MWSIIVHGGAGAIHSSVEPKHRAGCKKAAEAGIEVLEKGGASLDAVCAAVRVMEDDPTFNASYGGALDERGMATVDAAVMRGSDIAYGAIGSVAGVRRAVDLARRVMEDGRHCLLVGPGAVEFARKRGVPLVDPASLVTPSSMKDWERRMAELHQGTNPRADWTPVSEDGDTVGAVAIDSTGCISAATSTSGLTGRYHGRVGDSPIAGAGTYARDDLGGVSCTGHGETMMRTVLAHQVLHALQAGANPREILERELAIATQRAGGRGGMIVVLPGGRTAYARNTAHMGVAWASHGRAVETDF